MSDSAPDRLAVLHERLRQLILMRETAPKRPRWHAARMQLIWQLHREIEREETARRKQNQTGE